MKTLNRLHLTLREPLALEMNRTYVLLVLIALLLFSGCQFLDGSGEDRSGWEVQPGAIVFHGDTSTVTLAADTVQVGQPLRVTATTFGDGCAHAAGMRAEVNGLSAVLTPLDSAYTPRPNEACTLELKEMNHRADVTFATPGDARVVIRGVGRGPRFEGSEEVRFERAVVVVE